ncbi:hypothetical protein JL101_036355 (plasmid) [Skermanella rosea]|uniref:hypothetical protein n=1 Tax=Skermanella rosea TaxID=1817965 RepID=UPI001932CC17|nr:hypothetical protein [Skermanella rosea]UEM08169.1 hypothetical protein JL101_036355 [Skermanella rosea]
MVTKLPPIKPPSRRGIDPEAARALAESEGLGIPTAPDGVSSRTTEQTTAVAAPKEVKLQRGQGLGSFQADLPEELLDALRFRALKEKTSVKALVLRALHDSGYPVPPEFLADKRRRGR